MLLHAYKKAFTVYSIRSSFVRRSIWPLDPSRLLATPQPPTDVSLGHAVSVEQLEEILESKKAELCWTVLGDDSIVGPSGWVDTRKATVLTAERALELASNQQQCNVARNAVEALKVSLAAERNQAKARVQVGRMQKAAWSCHAAICGMDIVV